MKQWQAIIVAGGRGSRLGGVDKPLLESAGRSLLDRALAATAMCRATVVVGRGTASAAMGGVLRVDEDPRFGGPAAAVWAGLSALAAGSQPAAPEWTLVIAADLPLIEAAVPALLAAVPAEEGDEADRDPQAFLAIDGHGVRQYLLAAYRTAALQIAFATPGGADGASMHSFVRGLRTEGIPMTDGLCDDVDTPEDAWAFGIVVPAAAAARDGESARVA